MKDFKQEFQKFHKMIVEKTPFSFIRFSDGEMFILQNKELKLAETHYQIGNTVGQGIYPREEQKHFIPGDHEWIRLALERSLSHSQQNYFKGIPSHTDTTHENVEFLKEIAFRDHTHYHENDLTYANLFINSNYPEFMDLVVKKQLCDDRPIAMVVNQAADLSKLPFKVKKDFRIGSNCMLNNYSTVGEVRDFLKGKTGWTVLLSAASLSNMIAHPCFADNPKNTFLDIGSTLNPMLGLQGWQFSRDYLKHYWMGIKSEYCTREEKW